MNQAQTIVNQLPKSSHAVVIGASIAGLLAARVLADYFDRVTVVERDRLPEKLEPRPGVPQCHQAHVLLARGQQILEQFLPGWQEEMAEKGAVTLNWTGENLWLLSDGWMPRFPSHLISQACSRNLLERAIRQRLNHYPQIQLRETAQVTQLLAEEKNSAVRGIEWRDRQGTLRQLAADLVVDASGRNSQAPQWLQELGYPLPQETTIDSFLGYASRWYQRPPNFQSDWKVIYLMGKVPDKTRSGVLFPVEGDRWIVTLIGIGRDYPPAEEEGFLEFARSLRHPLIYDLIKDAQPISSIYSYRRTQNRLRHYEKLSRLPDNFILLGDAVCAFNPVYGQGMTVAALGALTLDNCLQQWLRQPGREGNIFPQHFQQQLAQVIQTPWLMSTGEDCRWPTTVGGQTNFVTRLRQGYLDEVMKLATKNADVYQSFAEVTHLLKPPTTLLQPRILA